jgi:hypothetical protein
MSIYSCIDSIEGILRAGALDVSSSVFTFTKWPLSIFLSPNALVQRPLVEDEITFLGNISEELKKIGARIDPDSQETKKELAVVIEKLEKYSSLPENKLSSVLDPVLHDLKIVRDGRTRKIDPDKPPVKLSPTQQAVETQYEALLKSPLLIIPLVQGTMSSLGNSKGECYGFTHSMVDSRSSPYKNTSIRDIQLTEAIHNYQKNQNNREKDQDRIKRTRLTTIQFCPSLNEQAQELYKIASKRVGEELAVTLDSRLGGHQTYLSVQPDNKIRYADSNHGVFLFDNKEQFISAYKLMYQYHNQFLPDAAYKFYCVSKLQEDEGNKLNESITVGGKWRSFLTGKKYGSLGALDPVFWPTALVGATAGAALGGVVGSAVPIIGTVVGAVVGGVLGAMGGYNLAKSATNNGHRGLLGTYHYLRERLHSFGEAIKVKLGIRRECDEVPHLDLPKEVETSHANMAALGLGFREEPGVTVIQVSREAFGHDQCPEGKQEIAEDIAQAGQDGADQYNVPQIF